MLLEKCEISLVFAVFEDVVEGYDCGAEEVLEGFAQLFALHEFVDLALEGPVLFLHLLLLVHVLIFALLALF